MFTKDIFCRVMDGLYPRLISQIDRDPDSPTYGSCDRHHWMYRLHDFDSGVLQQTSLTLAFLALTFEQAELADNLQNLKKEYVSVWRHWAKGINDYNLKLLSRKFALDEYYPGESSYPGTVFAAYATLKSAVILNQDIVLTGTTLRNVANRFLNRRPGAAANQDAAAAAFLSLYATQNDWKNKVVRSHVENLLAGPQKDHSFSEYGGLDLGYGSVTLNYLAAMQADGSHDVRSQIDDLACRLVRFITPSGQFGGQFCTRSTTYFLPFGFYLAAQNNPKLASKISTLDTLGTFSRIDDRYLMHYCSPSLARTIHEIFKHTDVTTTYRKPETGREPQIWHDKLGGLLSWQYGKTSIYVGLRKGGCVHIENNGKTLIDNGYRVKKRSKTYSTGETDKESFWDIKWSKENLIVVGKIRFVRYPILIATAKTTVILRLLSFLGSTLNYHFRRLLIQEPQFLSDAILQRKITIDQPKTLLRIEDSIIGLSSKDHLTIAPPISLRLVPSAQFHQPGEEIAHQAVKQKNATDNTIEFVREFYFP